MAQAFHVSPSGGKSAFALNVMRRQLDQGKRVALFSLEMSAAMLSERQLCSGTYHTSPLGMPEGISSEDLSQAGLNSSDWSYINRYYEQLKDENSIICDQGGLTAAAISSHVGTIQRKGGLDLVIIDYLQLMGAPVGYRMGEFEKVTHNSQAVKNIAKRFRVPVLLLSQLSREQSKAKRRPVLSDLRQSGQIEQDADLVVFLYEPSPVSDSPVELTDVDVIVAKNRNGSCGIASLRVYKPSYRYLSATGRQA